MADQPGWKDISSYAKGDKERVPHSFELRAGRTLLVVTRHIYIPKDSWQLEMHGSFTRELPGNKTADEAKLHCLMLARDQLRESLETVTKVLEASEAEARMEATLPAPPINK